MTCRPIASVYKVLSILWAGLFLAVLNLESAVAQVPRQQHTSVRSLGMGGAYTAVVDNEESLFHNPAGLGRVRGLNLRFFDFQLGANGTKMKEAVDTLTEDEIPLHEALSDLYGESYGFHTEFRSLITVPGLGAGVFGSAGLEMVLDNPAYSHLEIAAMADYGMVVGAAVPVVPGVFTLGSTVKRFTRRGSSLLLGPSVLGDLDTDNILDEVLRTGVGYSLDLGANLDLPGPLQPTFSVVWKNVGQTAFRSAAASDPVPRPDRDEIIVGAALNIQGPFFSIRPALDYRYSNWAEMQFGKKLHLGVEVRLPLIDARAGFHQGYYTLGAGAKLGFLRLDVATYGVELGVYPGHLEDRRYILQISTGLGLNPSLNFSGSGGDGRDSQLKQRR